MSTSASRTDPAGTDLVEGDAPSVPGTALVDESRRVLVHLLQGPFLDGRRDGARYAQLLRDRAALEARLADLFLELIVDDDAQVAFVRQSEEDPDAPKLLRRLTGMNRLDSVLMLVLRQMLLTQSSRGQRTVVSEAELAGAGRLSAHHLDRRGRLRQGGPRLDREDPARRTAGRAGRRLRGLPGAATDDRPRHRTGIHRALPRGRGERSRGPAGRPCAGLCEWRRRHRGLTRRSVGRVAAVLLIRCADLLPGVDTAVEPAIDARSVVPGAGPRRSREPGRR
nr:DUF4194 domain-containing protein [Brachybacterium sp. Z12]